MWSKKIRINFLVVAVVWDCAQDQNCYLRIGWSQHSDVDVVYLVL